MDLASGTSGQLPVNVPGQPPTRTANLTLSCPARIPASQPSSSFLSPPNPNTWPLGGHVAPPVGPKALPRCGTMYKSPHARDLDRPLVGDTWRLASEAGVVNVVVSYSCPMRRGLRRTEKCGHVCRTGRKRTVQASTRVSPWRDIAKEQSHVRTLPL